MSWVGSGVSCKSSGRSRAQRAVHHSLRTYEPSRDASLVRARDCGILRIIGADALQLRPSSYVLATLKWPRFWATSFLVDRANE